MSFISGAALQNIVEYYRLACYFINVKASVLSPRPDPLTHGPDPRVQRHAGLGRAGQGRQGKAGRQAGPASDSPV